MFNIFGLGSWRFLLAFFVAISHLWAGMFGGPAAYAVWGFFVLSGFLMTEILRNKYGFTVQGLQKYAFNRFIRIFPLYYLTFLSGILVIYILGQHNIDPKVLNPQFYIPDSVYLWFSNLSLLPLPSVGPRPVPVSDALAVEVGVYLLIPFMAYSRSAAWLGAIISLILSLKIGIDVESFPARYSDFLTGYFAFAIGSLINHYKNELERIAMPKISLLIWGIHCLFIGVINTWPWTYGLYISVLLSAWVVISLHKLETSKTDTLLGDLSYPIYLLHTTIGAYLLLYFDTTRSLTFFLTAFIITVLISWVLLIIFDHPIQRLKKKANSGHKEEISVDQYLSKLFYKFQSILVHKNTIKFTIISGVVIGIGLSAFVYKVATNKTLEIYNWGPQETIVGIIPNLQPDGNAGIWIETGITKGLGKLEVCIDGVPIHTEVTTNLITASIPKEYFQETKKLTISIQNDDNRIKNIIGTLHINEEKTIHAK